jgi:hypothetical protein
MMWAVALVAILVAGASFAAYGWIAACGLVALYMAVIGILAVAIDLRQGHPWRAIFWFVCIMPGIIMLFAAIYCSTGLIVAGADTQPEFETAIYFSIVTWTTLGYGDIAPTPVARPWAAFEVLIGYIYMAVLVSVIMMVVTPKSTAPNE